MKKIRIPRLTRKEDHQIRRALLIGLYGFRFPPEVGDERQEDGRLPFYQTVRMAEKTMIEMLTLKAEVAKFLAEEAQKYAEKFIPDDGEMPYEGRKILGKEDPEEKNEIQIFPGKDD